MESKTTTDRDYADAIQVQDACNLSGVVYSFARVMERICEETRETGTASKNGHAIAVMFASKIASLTRCEDWDVFSQAYDTCKTKQV